MQTGANDKREKGKNEKAGKGAHRMHGEEGARQNWCEAHEEPSIRARKERDWNADAEARGEGKGCCGHETRRRGKKRCLHEGYVEGAPFEEVELFVLTQIV